MDTGMPSMGSYVRMFERPWPQTPFILQGIDIDEPRGPAAATRATDLA
jgi:hypothetical protein